MKTDDLSRQMQDAMSTIPVGPAPTSDIIRRGRRARTSSHMLAASAAAALVVVGAWSTGVLGSEDPADVVSQPQGADEEARNLQVQVDECRSKGTRGALDVPGPGRSTPESAVMAVDATGGSVVRVQDADRFAQVAVVDESKTVLRVYAAYERADGWWPDSMTECSSS